SSTRSLTQVWPSGSLPRDRAVGRAAASHGRDRALCPISGQRALSNQSLMDQLKHLIEVWTSYAQGLTGSIGALAFVCAFIWKMIAIEPRSVMEAKRWIGR